MGQRHGGRERESDGTERCSESERERKIWDRDMRGRKGKIKTCREKERDAAETWGRENERDDERDGTET